MQSKASIVASEQAGTTVGLLLMDTERQAANYREKVNQSIESMQRQYCLMFKLQNHNLKAEEISYKVISMKLIMPYQV